MKETVWWMPDYFEKFTCKIDQCRNTCCRMWKIPVSRKKYNQLITMDCSEELNQNLQQALILPKNVSEERFREIGFNYLGDCPFMKGGYCSLYAEKGEDYLPEICRLFPRSFKSVNGQNLAIASNACERVVELIYDSERLDLKKKEYSAMPIQNIQISEENAAMILKFQLIFQNSDEKLYQKIAQVCRTVNLDAFTADEKKADDPVSTAIFLLSHLVGRNSALYPYTNAVIRRYEENPDLYASDTEHFESLFPEWMSLYEKLINNSMMYEIFPFVDESFDNTDAYMGLCCTYGLLRFLSVGYTALHPSKEDLIDVIAALFHLVDHTAFYKNITYYPVNAACMLKL